MYRKLRTVHPVKYAWIFIGISESIFLALCIKDQNGQIFIDDIFSIIYIATVFGLFIASFPMLSNKIHKENRSNKSIAVGTNENNISTINTSPLLMLNESTQGTILLKTASDKMLEKLEAIEKIKENSSQIVTNSPTNPQESKDIERIFFY